MRSAHMRPNNSMLTRGSFSLHVDHFLNLVKGNTTLLQKVLVRVTMAAFDWYGGSGSNGGG